MTTTDRQTRVQSAPLPDGDCFDMWHDYMNLAGLLERLCYSRQRETEGPEQQAAAAWSHIHTSQWEKCQTSTETSSASSSVSDTSCSSSQYCRFCKQNGESAGIYRSHRLKSGDGRVTCPILCKYTCPTCGATGERAHTRKYCPRSPARMLSGPRSLKY